MERFYKRQHTLLRMRGGPLGVYAEELARQLGEEGYSKPTGQYALRLIANLGWWLNRHGMTVEQLTQENLKCYLDYHSSYHSRRTGDAATLRRLSGLLVAKGVVAAEGRSEPTPAQRLEEEFRQYLLQERKLTPGTVVQYLVHVRRFLAECFANGEQQIKNLCAADIIQFVRQESVRLHSTVRAKDMTTALRSFLQYARYRDIITTDLRSSVPTVANWSMASLPMSLSSDEVERLLAHCDRTTALGRRNLAVLLLLARLGLRAGEVSGLTLDDLDWERGELCIRSLKGQNGHSDRLPMPQDVGEALAEYLRYSRPTCSSRSVFIRLNAPHRGFASSVAITCLVSRLLKRAKLKPPHKSAHLLRHFVATHLLRQGASLAEIGELLRHRNQQSTTIYAKVGLDLLRPLALPWPGDAQ